MEAMAWHAMASIDCHGRGGILQNSTEAMEIDLVEIFIKNVVKKLLVELKYKTKDNLMPN